MPSSPRSAKHKRTTAPGRKIDTTKFEHVHQIGGIRTATFDYPAPNGGQSCKVATVDTGSGLRFVVALDRGGDIVEAFYNEHSLTFLTPNGYKPPNPAYHTEEDWLDGWPGGLVTTCGPQYLGPPREEDGNVVSLHGRYSNTPAAIEMILNPDPHRGRHEMLIAMHVRDTRMYGPSFEIRRQIQCVLGVPEIHIFDEVMNRDSARVAHNWMYHVNLGYPLLDKGAKYIVKGTAETLYPPGTNFTTPQLEKIKTVSGGRKEHLGDSSNVFMTDVPADRKGMVHAGLINEKLGLGFELEYPHADLPRLNTWQHFGPAGCFVTGIEPLNGSLLGKDEDKHPLAEQWLEPGESKRYHLTLRVLPDAKRINAFKKHDGKLTAIAP